jgi:hypothetical protein
MTARLLTFILFGLMFAIPGEILNQILARHNIAAFRTTLISYTFLLFIGFFAWKGLHTLLKNRARAALAHYLLFGTLGLMVEWLLLGNAPVLDPFQIITQPGMFTFWGTMLLGPALMMETSEFQELKNAFFCFFVVMSLLYLLLAVVLPKEKGGIFLGFVFFAGGTTALNYFYLKYFRKLAALS